METIEKHPSPNLFVREHRSYIVNINKIRTIERNRIIIGKVYISISDSYKERISKLLAQRAIN